MEQFCIIVNRDKDRDNKMALYIMDYLKQQGASCVLAAAANEDQKEHGLFTNMENIPKETQCAIVLGGDGTIIQAAKDLQKQPIPILGVNLGTVGFLAEIEPHMIRTALDRLLLNDLEIEERLMLHGKTTIKGEKSQGDHALNDIFVTKRGVCRLIGINLYINDVFIDTYVGDGLIVSTPTGSTGYNLSAGGPIMRPGIEAVVITPTCPHSLNKRSLVVSSEDTIRLEIGRRKEDADDQAYVYYDGVEQYEVTSGDVIEIIRSKEKTKIIKLSDNSYFDILKNKLGKEQV